MFTSCAYDRTGAVTCIYNGYPYQCTETETPEQWQLLQEKIASGEIKVLPYVEPPPPPPEPQAEALARAIVDIKRQRSAILSTLDGISGRMYRKGEVDLSQAADDAIEALLDITDLPQLLEASTYDEMKAAVLLRYRQIAAAAPAIVQSAFIEAVAP